MDEFKQEMVTIKMEPDSQEDDVRLDTNRDRPDITNGCSELTERIDQPPGKETCSRINK